MVSDMPEQRNSAYVKTRSYNPDQVYESTRVYRLISVVLSYPPHKGKAASASREREMQSRVFKIRLSWSNIH